MGGSNAVSATFFRMSIAVAPRCSMVAVVFLLALAWPLAARAGIANDMSARTDAVALPSGTTAQEPSSPINGMIRYNSSVPQFEGYINGAWSPLASNPGTGCSGPSAFSFTNATNQSLSTVVTSNTITPSGCSTLNLSVFVSGGGSPQISINGGAWASSGA